MECDICNNSFNISSIFSFTKESGGGYAFTLENYKEVIDPIYMKVFGRSILLAGGATLICLIVGYPVAYIISKARVSRRGSLILLFILPMWMNFLLRTYAWVAILGKNGLLNTFLGWFGIQPLAILYTNFAILLGMVYNFTIYGSSNIYSTIKDG